VTQWKEGQRVLINKFQPLIHIKSFSLKSSLTLIFLYPVLSVDNKSTTLNPSHLLTQWNFSGLNPFQSKIANKFDIIIWH
jgi:hypothetical protein